MNRRLWLICVALALIAAGIRLQYQPERLAVAAPLESPSPQVRIQHEFVRIPAAAAVIPTPPPQQRVQHPVRRAMSQYADAGELEGSPAAAPPRQIERANRDRTLFEKARRAFVGDGRYKPEPFPRVR